MIVADIIFGIIFLCCLVSAIFSFFNKNNNDGPSTSIILSVFLIMLLIACLFMIPYSNDIIIPFQPKKEQVLITKNKVYIDIGEDELKYDQIDDTLKLNFEDIKFNKVFSNNYFGHNIKDDDISIERKKK